PTHIGVRRASAGIDPRHASIAHGGEHHGDHGNQNRSDYVTLASVTEHAISGHGSRRLDDDNAVKNQVPKRERSTKPQAGGGRSVRSGFHSRVLDYAGAANVND